MNTHVELMEIAAAIRQLNSNLVVWYLTAVLYAIFFNVRTKR